MKRLVFALLLVLFMAPQPVFAQWPADPKETLTTGETSYQDPSGKIKQVKIRLASTVTETLPGKFEYVYHVQNLGETKIEFAWDVFWETSVSNNHPGVDTWHVLEPKTNLTVMFLATEPPFVDPDYGVYLYADEAQTEPITFPGFGFAPSHR